jgi:hypothetical protein
MGVKFVLELPRTEIEYRFLADIDGEPAGITQSEQGRRVLNSYTEKHTRLWIRALG